MMRISSNTLSDDRLTMLLVRQLRISTGAVTAWITESNLQEFRDSLRSDTTIPKHLQNHHLPQQLYQTNFVLFQPC